TSRRSWPRPPPRPRARGRPRRRQAHRPRWPWPGSDPRTRSGPAERARRRPIRSIRLSPPPSPHRHPRTLAEVGRDLELVHQTPRARQAKTQTAGGRIAILHGAIEVGNSGSVVGGHDLDAALEVILDESEHDLSVQRVANDVPRPLRDRGGDDGQIGYREPAPRR